ncbi:MAG: hypothetical protein HY674_00965 [Chloroflexi bacterium]|nr:hypothetical protein [Chloroflexota bacterium]
MRLHDYSGANSSDIFTDSSGRITVWVPPCSNPGRTCYTVWAPAGISGGFNPPVLSTTQEWHMADDLGDSHASSLGQGGALPPARQPGASPEKSFLRAAPDSP